MCNILNHEIMSQNHKINFNHNIVGANEWIYDKSIYATYQFVNQSVDIKHGMQQHRLRIRPIKNWCWMLFLQGL